MKQISWAEGIGYMASLLVFCTFCMKTMLPLRGVAIASNIAFMAYRLAGGIYPVFVLHVVLLPLNCLRLRQMRRLIRKVREASRGDMSAEWLIPLAEDRSQQRCASRDSLVNVEPAAARRVAHRPGYGATWAARQGCGHSHEYSTDTPPGEKGADCHH